MPKTKRNKSNSKNWIAIIALFVALFGGIPGIIQTCNHFSQPALSIDYDADNSIGCFIESDNAKLNGKIVVILYRITVVGKGSKPVFIKKFNLYLKCKDQWLKGEFLRPEIKEVSDKKGEIRSAVMLRHRNEAGAITDTMYVADWINFASGDKSLKYGEPEKFSIAIFFEKYINEYDSCKKLRIHVVDYLNNTFKRELDVWKSMEDSRYQLSLFSAFNRRTSLVHKLTETEKLKH